MFQLWSSARYTFPLPDGHRFPIAKYELLREQVLIEGIVPPEALHEPARASRDESPPRAHRGLRRSLLRRRTDARASYEGSDSLGLPHSSNDRYGPSGGTCEAAVAALEHGVAMNLAGGTHHAFPDHGEGFCVFNDVAVAVRLLQRAGRIRACGDHRSRRASGQRDERNLRRRRERIHLQHARRTELSVS